MLAATTGIAGGPKFVAGVSYFNPGVKGQAVHWAQGQVGYFVDQGPLNSLVNNQQATEMVDAAAATWSAVPTAAVTLMNKGPLAENVSGANIVPGIGVVNGGMSAIAQPSDVAATATATPVGVIFDADGSVIDALEGTGASEPDNCWQNGVFVWIDKMNPDATMAHGAILLNGRCATNASLLTMMSFQLERAFGRILGLDFSQVNDGAQSPGSTEINGALGWPVMLPLSGDCSSFGGECIPDPTTLRLDDIAALNRIYPVTAANQFSFPGKVLTAANTISLQGTISFRNGMGMQGVNVVARPLDANGNPLYQYTTTFVSGGYFGGNHGNPVTGWTDANGNRLDQFGSDDASLQGYFDLSGIPLPPGATEAKYEITFEAVNPLYIDQISVGPYILGSPTPSGTLATMTVQGMTAGNAKTLDLTIADSASELQEGYVRPVARPVAPLIARSALEANPVHSAPSGLEPVGNEPQSNERNAGNSIAAPAIGIEGAPQLLPSSGMWTSRLGQVGQTDWFTLPVRGNRIFTIVTQALNEAGTSTMTKAMPAIGVWDGFDLVGSAAAGSAPAQNGFVSGETRLQVATSGNDIVRLAVADQRGDGRPDYTYRGWVLYADSVAPARLPVSGGTIVIHGMGFRAGDSVLVGGVAVTVTSILPNEITALVPAAMAGVIGSLDVEVDDLPLFNAAAAIPGGFSYDAGSGDGLVLVTAPANQVPMDVPQPFSVFAEGANGAPAGGVTVIYSVTSGVATLGCGLTTCSVTASGDARATMAVTAINSSIAVVTASLTNGASVQAHFYGGPAAVLNALTPTLYLAAGATTSWPVQALALSGGAPAGGQTVTWQSVPGMTTSGSTSSSASTTNSAGVASATLAVGPLSEGQTITSVACLNGGGQCASFNAFGSRPEFASLTAISGTSQSLSATDMLLPVTLRVLDMNGNPMAGGTVSVYQELYAWAPACPQHGRCAQPQLLAAQSTTLTSTLDGSVTVIPLTLAGQPTNLIGLAATGNASSLIFTVEQHP